MVMGPPLAHAHPDQTLVHAGDDVALAHVRVVGVVARVAVETEGRPRSSIGAVRRSSRGPDAESKYYRHICSSAISVSHLELHFRG